MYGLGEVSSWLRSALAVVARTRLTSGARDPLLPFSQHYNSLVPVVNVAAKPKPPTAPVVA